eukprot:15454424-Alexandrium_andersonii.AAC.1
MDAPCKLRSSSAAIEPRAWAVDAAAQDSGGGRSRLGANAPEQLFSRGCAGQLAKVARAADRHDAARHGRKRCRK